MCARRKERSDGIAIATKSIASSALPVGLCRRQKGETREEGGHALRGLRTELIKKSTQSSAFILEGLSLSRLNQEPLALILPLS